nr:MAG TPA: hypothetical protein [Caudoviricetes sp.]
MFDLLISSIIFFSFILCPPASACLDCKTFVQELLLTISTNFNLIFLRA